MKILITAFKAFDNRNINISKETLKLLDTSSFNFEIDKLYLPVALNTSYSIVNNYLKSNSPEVIILLGEAISRDKISIEIKAKNHILKSLSPTDEVDLNKSILINDGPNIIYSSFPTIEALSCVLTNNIPTEISIDAGGYICNALYYQVQYNHPTIPTVFIHFPHTSEKLTICDMAKALEIIINSL